MEKLHFVEIERVEKLAVQECQDNYYKNSIPVVIPNGASDWGASEKWNPEWFRDNYGSEVVPISVGHRRNMMISNMKLEDFVDRMRKSEEQIYFRFFDVFSQMPKLLEDIQVPIYCPQDREIAKKIWMGHNTFQPLHQDHHHPMDGLSNLFVQIYGDKKVILAAPDQTPFLYQQKGADVDYHLSAVDLEKPDFDKFPLLKRAILWKTQLSAGDMLLIPQGHWHSMRSQDTSISISFWWRQSLIFEWLTTFVKLSKKSPDQLQSVVNQNRYSLDIEDIVEFGGVDTVKVAMSRMSDANQKRFLMLFSPSALAQVTG